LPSTEILPAEADPGWSEAFRLEARRIRAAFGALLIELHHIGSTAVPGLPAKPVIDILAVVSNVRALDAQTAQFEALGYEVMGEFGLPGRRYFRRDDSNGVRTHQVHAYAAESSSEIERHLNFRDYIREHPETARAYANLKQRLADDCHGDMRCYSDGKTAFIREIEQRAALWKRTASREHRTHNAS
jgi:GrpB-like predicted nucleotidyltransferase (UPF0157 family)